MKKFFNLGKREDSSANTAEGTGFEPVHPFRDTGFRNPRN